MQLFKLLGAVGLVALGLVSGQSVQQIHKLMDKDADGLAKFTLEGFMKNVVAEGRDYSVVVQLTALAPKYQCGPCQELDKTLRSVARGWKRTGGDRNRVVFGSLDVEDGEQLFSQMKIDKIPRLMIFPADTGPHKFANPQTRELNVNGKTMRAEGLAEKLSELFGVKISADVPIDYSKYLMNACTVVAVIYACTLVYKYISLQFLGRNLFTVATISFVLLMTSGYMWNRINDPPYVGQTGAQEAVLFAPTNQQQYGVETQIVAATYAVCALCIVGLVRHAPRIQNQDQRIFITFAFVVALIMTFSYLNSVFRIKMQGYPYKLLFP